MESQVCAVKWQRKKIKAFSTAILTVAILTIAIPMQITAAQFEAPYYALDERHKTGWEKQDKQINEKLAAL